MIKAPQAAARNLPSFTQRASRKLPADPSVFAEIPADGDIVCLAHPDTVHEPRHVDGAAGGISFDEDREEVRRGRGIRHTGRRNVDSRGAFVMRFDIPVWSATPPMPART